MIKIGLKIISGLLFFIVVGLFITLPAMAVSKYNLTNLGSGKYLYAINNQGQIAGIRFSCCPNENILFIYEKGITTELCSLGQGQPYDINDSGKIVGSVNGKAFIWEDGEIKVIPEFKDIESIATAINNNDQILINDYSDNYFSKAYIYQNGSLTPLNQLGNKTLAWGINNLGHAVGFSTAGGSGSFLFKDGIMQNIGSFPLPRFNSCYNINDSDEIVGLYDSGTTYVPYFWAKGDSIDIGTLYGWDTRAYNINNIGQVVGRSHGAPEGGTHGFIWENLTTYNLNDLIPSDSGWIILDARDINDNGEIIGQGLFDGQEHAILLTPVPDILDVEIDIRPLSPLNIISLWPKKGIIPIALLSTQEVYMPDMIDKESLTFGYTGDEDSAAFCSNKPVDVNNDGYPDLLCFFYKEYTGFQCGDTEGILKGFTVDGLPIEGMDSIRVIPCK